MVLPPGVIDPLFLHELALELHMTVREMCNQMDAHELTVCWPLYFEYRNREAERQAAKQDAPARTLR
jgi:hypothetical protein